MKRTFLTGVFLIAILLGGHAQQNISVEEYIDIYKDLAVEEMKKYRVPASITLAQGILESNAGNSPLARIANNHFGIKCHKEWTGKTFYQDDDEENECFRKYTKASESYKDHSEFLSTRDRYKSLFQLEISDYKGWAYGLKQAGYATNPKYPELLIRIIEENRLYIFDLPDNHQVDLKNQQSEIRDQQSEINTKPEVFEIFGRAGNDRIVFLNNGVKFIFARDGDDLFLIASEFEIYTWQLYKYNDMDRDEKISSGQKVYLEKKKAKSGYENHTVIKGETLQSISQDFGITVKTICRKNKKNKSDLISQGEKIRLR